MLASNSTPIRNKKLCRETVPNSWVGLKWIYRYPKMYDLLDTAVNLGLSNKARAQLVKSINGKALEVGVGSGKSIPHFKGKDFFGVDISLSMLKRAKRYTPNLCVASAYNLPFKEHSFDKVLFIYTLRVLDTQEKALEEAFRVGDEVIVLEFKPLPKLFELFGRRAFGSCNINTNILKGFAHKDYLNRFEIYRTFRKTFTLILLGNFTFYFVILTFAF